MKFHRFLRMILSSSKLTAWQLMGSMAFAFACFNPQAAFAQTAELDADVFNAQFYLSHYSDLSSLTTSQAMTHWLNFGIGEGRQGSATFWSQEYMALYPAVATAVGATNYDGAIQNYVNYGRGQARIGVCSLSPNVYDFQTYITLNPDLAKLGQADAQSHWLNHGINEGRRANWFFAASDYIKENPAVPALLSANAATAIQDYVLRGAALNRNGLIATDPDVYNSDFFMQNNSGIGTNPNTAKLNWIQSGLAQGLVASPAFSALQYLARYPDLANAYGSTNFQAALTHYITFGRKAGRSGLTGLASDTAFQQVASTITSPVTATAADRLVSFTAPDGRTVKIVVRVPVNPSGPAITAPALAAGVDAYAYFATWIKTAIQQHASRLTFPQANYIVTAPASSPHLNLSGLSDAVVDFSGSTLTFKSLTSGLQLISNQRVIVRNATLDFSAPIAAPATVVSGANGSKMLVVNSSYPVPPDALVRSVSLFDLGARKWVQSPGVELFLSSPYPTINGQIVSSSGFSQLPLGATVLIRYHLYEGAGVYVGGTSTQDIAFENLTLYQAPGEGFNIYNAGRGFRISNCKIAVNPNDPLRLISLATDAAHFTSSGGDIILENNDFASQGDDALNLAATLSPVLADTITAGVETVAFSNALPVIAEERLAFYNTGMGLLGVASVKSIATSGTSVLVTLNQTVAGINNLTRVTNLDRANSRYYIMNNSLHDNRARAMLLQAPNGWVQGNVMARQTLSSVNIMADTKVFPEGPGAANLRFTGNTITAPGTNHLGALGVYVNLSSGVIAPEAVEQQIMIDANKISQTPGPAIFVGSARKVSVLNNTITNANLVPDAPALYFGSASSAASIVVTKSQAVTLSGNSRDQSTSGPISVDTTTTGGISVQPTY